MNKVVGIKSVDFKVVAEGNGVVNWNGPTQLAQRNGESRLPVNNHSLPKLRGYSNLNGKVNDNGYNFYREPSDIDFKETPMYISQNCIRHHLFRDQAFDLHNAKDKNLIQVLASITGLVKGYSLPSSSQCKRTSPLLLEDFVDQLGKGNFEQHGRCGSKEGEDKSSTFFSKTTFGKTKYLAYGSISIEQLQFISLDNKYGRAAMIANDGQGEKIAASIQEFIKKLDPSRNPMAVFHDNYVRSGTIFEEGESGIMLDNEAIDVLVKETLRMIGDLTIRQGKGYMYVTDVEADYNDSNKMMRIKRDPSAIVKTSNGKYAEYFYPKSSSKSK
jgi:hypothetical protein